MFLYLALDMLKVNNRYSGLIVPEPWGLLLFVMQLLISIFHITDCLEKAPAKLIMFPTSISIIIIP